MIRYKKRLLAGLLSFGIGAFPLCGQFEDATAVFKNLQSNPYPNPLVGGFNNPQFSSIDMNWDGVADLLVFDRVGNVWLPFRNNNLPNTSNYTFAPEWIPYFPPVEQWALARDYNRDGIMDIFCNYRNPSQGYIGIGVYKGYRVGNGLSYTLVKDILFAYNPQTNQSDNIFVSNIDIPAVADMDNDGDMDILTFNQSGGYVELFNNQSQEQGHGSDSLIFRFADNCWGRFYESGVGEALDLSPRIDSCRGYGGWSPLRTGGGYRHSGSTLSVLDMDADGDKELFLGDISFTNIGYGLNTGSTQTAFISQEETFFPANSRAVRIQNFPAAYFLDINNDQKTDMLVSPSTDAQSENWDCAWAYHNTGTVNNPRFEFQTANFLVNEMLDFGTNSAPVFADVDGDGLQDLIIGTGGVFLPATATYRSGLHLFKNVGTSSTPIFEHRDTNFAGLNAYNLRRPTPVFADLDADNDLDLLLGNEEGQLVWVQNIGTANNPSFATPVLNYKGIDIGANSRPALSDLDADGDLDLVMGGRVGNLSFFRNIGTNNSADFAATATINNFGGVDVRDANATEGNSSPYFVQTSNGLGLLVGAESGKVSWYGNILGNLNGNFNLLTSSAPIQSVDAGRQSAPCAINLDTDTNLEVLVGNRRGGISNLSSNQLPNSVVELPESLPIRPKSYIFPNPVQNGRFTLGFLGNSDNFVSNSPFSVQIYTLTGQLLQARQAFSTDMPLEIVTNALPKGVFLVKLSCPEWSETHRLLILD